MAQGIASHFVSNKSFKSSFKKNKREQPNSKIGRISDNKSDGYSKISKSTFVEAVET